MDWKLGRLISFGVVMVFSLAAFAQDVKPANKAQLAAIKASMEDRLKDAGSAKFMHVSVNKDGNVCGMVNSKNSYGAYAGYTPFSGMVFQRGKQYVAIVLGLDSPEVTRSVCEENGIPLPP